MYDRVCPTCKMHGLENCGSKHDPCIENLPNTEDACCGHGWVSQAYVTLNPHLPYENRTVLRGKKALAYFLRHKGQIWLGNKGKRGRIPYKDEWG